MFSWRITVQSIPSIRINSEEKYSTKKRNDSAWKLHVYFGENRRHPVNDYNIKISLVDQAIEIEVAIDIFISPSPFTLSTCTLCGWETSSSHLPWNSIQNQCQKSQQSQFCTYDKDAVCNIYTHGFSQPTLIFHNNFQHSHNAKHSPTHFPWPTPWKRKLRRGFKYMQSYSMCCKNHIARTK